MGASESTGRSNGTVSEEVGEGLTELVATAVAIGAGVAAAWGISKILFDITASQEEKDDDMAIKAPNSSNQPRSRINTGQSSGYGGISQYDGDHKSISSDVVKQPIIWYPPPRGRFKMNTDGACQPNGPGGQGGYGGILRNDQCNFECCFYGFIGKTDDALIAELQGILQGLKLLNKFGCMGSILETDCQAAYQWVTEKKDGSRKKNVISDCWPTITECRRLIQANNIVVINIGEDANKCADKLAAKALKEKDKYMEFHYVVDCIKDLVDKDRKPHGFPLIG